MQPYELSEFEAPYLNADSAPLAQLGLHQMKAALFGDGRTVLPPPSHSCGDPNKQDLFYDYRQDITARGDLLSGKGVVITPAALPPCPVRLAASVSLRQLLMPPHASSVAGNAYPPLPEREGEAGPSLLLKLAGDMANITSEQNTAAVLEAENTPAPELGPGGGVSTRATPTCSPVGVKHSAPMVLLVVVVLLWLPLRLCR